MKRKQIRVCMLLVLACGLMGCTKDVTHSGRLSSADSGTVSATTTAQTTAQTTTASTTQSTTQAIGTTVPTGTQPPLATNPFPTDDDTKLLWSDRGLATVPLADTEGYGEALAVGASFGDWTLQSFDGTVNADQSAVTALHADFTAAEPIVMNGIMHELTAADGRGPDGLYVRVDDLSLVPHVTADTRERGWVQIANPDVVRELLKTALQSEEAPQFPVAVTVTVTQMHLYYTENGSGNADTVTVSQVAKR